MKNFISSLLSDNSGGVSSSRALLLFWGLGVFFIWGYVCFIKKELVTLPSEIITVLLGLSAAKTVQRFGEN